MIRFQRLWGSGGSRTLATAIFLFAAVPATAGDLVADLPITEIVIRGNVAHFVPVQTGISGERFFEVLEGLKEGDEVVTGTYQAIRDLKDGDAVKVDNTSRKKEAGEARKG